jgi:hypothetical protein
VPRVAIRENYPVTDLDKGIVGWDDQSDPLNPRLVNVNAWLVSLLLI